MHRANWKDGAHRAEDGVLSPVSMGRKKKSGSGGKIHPERKREDAVDEWTRREKKKRKAQRKAGRAPRALAPVELSDDEPEMAAVVRPAIAMSAGGATGGDLCRMIEMRGQMMRGKGELSYAERRAAAEDKREKDAAALEDDLGPVAPAVTAKEARDSSRVMCGFYAFLAVMLGGLGLGIYLSMEMDGGARDAGYAIVGVILFIACMLYYLNVNGTYWM